jgi:hypothetical protein
MRASAGMPGQDTLAYTIRYMVWPVALAQAGSALTPMRSRLHLFIARRKSRCNLQYGSLLPVPAPRGRSRSVFQYSTVPRADIGEMPNRFWQSPDFIEISFNSVLIRALAPDGLGPRNRAGACNMLYAQ